MAEAYIYMEINATFRIRTLESELAGIRYIDPLEICGVNAVK